MLNAMFPEQCCGCQEIKNVSLCQECIAQLNIRPTQLPLIPEVDSVVGLLDYNNVIRNVLHNIKFERRSRLAKIVSEYIADQLDQPIFEECDIWIPVPIHWWRLRQRGFNQVNLLFESLVNKFGLPFDDCIHRSVATPPLSALNQYHRRLVMESAFCLKQRRQFRGASIVICDDILTTGTTCSKLSGFLKLQGARSVQVLSLSYV